ncbi:MAG TPA: ABC transporter permease subunit/CPBP intramembrane protease [Pirellulaceae bacterium]|nr:ABC transporter permease subunit/CPBP intramembrane protease [Pirellulaceae bacterium]
MNSQPETNGNEATTPNLAAPVRIQRTTVGRLGRLCLKELREILRDRRTIITLVFMPLLVNILLYMIFARFLTNSPQSASEIEVYVGVESEAAAETLSHYLSEGEAILNSRGEVATRPAAGRENHPVVPGAAQEPNIKLVETEGLRGRVAEGAVDVGIVIRPPTDDQPSQTLQWELIYREEKQLSATGVQFIEKRLNAINEQYIHDVLANRDVRRTLGRLNYRTELPTNVVHSTVGQTGSGFSLTIIVPLILILMTITGAVYPAIDLTAGERERGTMETLMAAPVPRLGLLIAKYVAVLTVALFTATANLVAMSVTLTVTGLVPTLFGDEGLSPLLVSQVFALLILFATFFSAILLALTSFARSFKEAQAYLIPVMLLALAPGIVSLVPELKFNGILAITPLVNVVLLARDMFESKVDPMLATVAVLSTILYAIAALALAARVFGSDAILYGSEGTWSDLWRRPSQSRPAPTIAGAMSCLALLFPANFLVSNSLRTYSEVSMTLWLALASVALIVLFVGLPMLFAFAQKVRIRSGFQLSPAAILAFLGAIVLGVSIWPFAHEIFLIQKVLGLSSLGEEQIAAAQVQIERLRQVPLIIMLLTLAVIPAVCEEFFFRGYLFSALRQTMRPWKTVVVSAMLFGAFHVVTTNALSVERFVPSTIMGLVLGWICLRGGSVLPGMLLHTCHNGLLLTILYYRDELAARGWGIQETDHMPPAWLATAAVVAVGSVALVWLATKKDKTATSAVQRSEAS